MKGIQRLAFILFLVFSFLARAQNSVYGNLKISGKDTIEGWLVSGADSTFFNHGEKRFFSNQSDTLIEIVTTGNFHPQIATHKRQTILKSTPDYFFKTVTLNGKLASFLEYHDGNMKGFLLSADGKDTIARAIMKGCKGLMPQKKYSFTNFKGKVESNCDCHFYHSGSEIEFHVSGEDSTYSALPKSYFEKSKTSWNKSINCEDNWIVYGSNRPEDIHDLTLSYIKTKDFEFYTKSSGVVFKKRNGKKEDTSSKKEMEQFVKSFDSTCFLRGDHYFHPVYHSIFYDRKMSTNQDLILNDTINFEWWFKTKYFADFTMASLKLEIKDGKLQRLFLNNDSASISRDFLLNNDHLYSALVHFHFSENYQHISKKKSGSWEVLTQRKTPNYSGIVTIKWEY